MAEITSIQFLRGTAAAWVSDNRVLEAGKPGVETDTGQMKLGNGTDAWNDLPYVGEGLVVGGGSGTVTSIATTSPITGGTITATGTIGITDAAADGSTKGAAAFTAADFNASSGVISIDYTNGQAASGSTKGFLTSADWTSFNGKTNNAWTVSTKTASYTLVSGDLTLITAGGKLQFLMNAASPLDFNIPTNANVAIPIGTKIYIFQYGTSQCTVVPLSGVTMRSALNANKTYTQYSEVCITKIATDEWVLSGDMTS